jgi:hypothetical protein
VRVVINRIRIDENDPQATLDIQTCKTCLIWTDILRLSFVCPRGAEALMWKKVNPQELESDHFIRLLLLAPIVVAIKKNCYERRY